MIINEKPSCSIKCLLTYLKFSRTFAIIIFILCQKNKLLPRCLNCSAFHADKKSIKERFMQIKNNPLLKALFKVFYSNIVQNFSLWTWTLAARAWQTFECGFSEPNSSGALGLLLYLSNNFVYDNCICAILSFNEFLKYYPSLV